MSASSMPTPFLVPTPSRPQSNVIAMPKAASAERARLVRRRPTREQGQGLEVLGHALEYLVDTRMFVYREPNTKADAEAIHILSRCSRELFATCAEVVPMRRRVKTWLAKTFCVEAIGSLGEAAERKA